MAEGDAAAERPAEDVYWVVEGNAGLALWRGYGHTKRVGRSKQAPLAPCATCTGCRLPAGPRSPSCPEHLPRPKPATTQRRITLP